MHRKTLHTEMLAAECDEVVDWGIVAALDVCTEELAAWQSKDITIRATKYRTQLHHLYQLSVHR